MVLLLVTSNSGFVATMSADKNSMQTANHNMVRRCSIRGTKGFQESYRSYNDALSCCYLFGVYKAEVECIEQVPPRPSWLALKMLLFRRYCGPRGSSQGHKVNTHVINRNNTSSMKLKK